MHGNVFLVYKFRIRHHRDLGPTALGPLVNDLQNGLNVKGQFSVLIYDLSVKLPMLIYYKTYRFKLGSKMSGYLSVAMC